MKLYSYFRSSAAYRLRIALAWKRLTYETAFIHLRKGEQAAQAYRAINPQKTVPTLIDGQTVVTQSLAAIEYLEERYPDPPLLPPDPIGRARVRSLAMMVACDIHPINNLRVLNYLRDDLKLESDARKAWYAHWITVGFEAIEETLTKDDTTGIFCHGDQPSLAEIALVPQVFNARRFDVDLTVFPTIERIERAALALRAFDTTRPEVQPDFES